MKILFAGDASNMHNCLAQELRKQGHTAVVVSNGSRWMNTARDINLYRHPGRWGAVRYVANMLRNLPKMRGFDIVEISNPIFFELRPERVRRVFDYLRHHNGKVVLSALGTDLTYYHACMDGHTYRYSDYLVGSEPSPYMNSKEFEQSHQSNWELPIMAIHHEHVLQHIHGIVACLWEYYEAYKPLANKIPLAYAGIPVDMSSIEGRPIEEEPAVLRLFIGIQRDRNVLKGTDRLLAAAQQLKERHPGQVEIDSVENVPYSEYVKRMQGCHVILDQLYSYTPATNALLAMARGLVAVSGAEPEYYDLICERENHPIVNVCPTPEGHILQQLEWLFAHKHLLPQLSRQSIDFVRKHNEASVVASRYLRFWQQVLEQ